MVKLLVRCNNFCINILKKQNTLRGCKQKKNYTAFFEKLDSFMLLTIFHNNRVQCTYYRHLNIHNQNQNLENNLENWLYFFNLSNNNVI